MQWIVGHKPKLRIVVIYISYLSAIDSFRWNIESTLELDFEGVDNLMGPNGPHFDLKYHHDIIYESQIDSRFILVHKGVLVISQHYTWDNEQGFWIGLIN